jgi:hypothetical protein
MPDLLGVWRSSFLQVMQDPVAAAPLKEASLTENLRAWTTCLTAAIVNSCVALGWRAAAKGHLLEHLPQPGQEYLNIDVMAFPAETSPVRNSGRWPMPLAAFELENHHKDDRVAYSLWKVLCLRADLRVVFAYRPDREQSRRLVTAIGDDVIGGMTPEQRSNINGETVVIIGNRGEGETFPWGYFKFWALDPNVGRFDKA